MRVWGAPSAWGPSPCVRIKPLISELDRQKHPDKERPVTFPRETPEVGNLHPSHPQPSGNTQRVWESKVRSGLAWGWAAVNE